MKGILILNLLVIAIILFGILVCRKKDIGKLAFGLSTYIEDKLKISSRMAGEKIKRNFQVLYGDVKFEEKIRGYYIAKIRLCILIILVTNVLSAMLVLSEIKNNSKENIVKRPEAGDGDISVSKVVEFEDGTKQEINFEVSEITLDEKKIKDVFEETKDYIDKNILGENDSFEYVCKPLNLVRSYMDGRVNITWITDEDGYIDNAGMIQDEIGEEGILVEITALITYLDKEEEYPIFLKLMPNDKESTYVDMLMEEIKKINESSPKEKIITLPSQINGQKVNYVAKEQGTPLFILVLGTLAAALIFFLSDNDIKSKYEERKEEMLIDFPEIVCKLCVLLKAGMTVKGAWGKIVADYSERKIHTGDRFAYEEMSYAWNEMNNGISEYQAYENFGKRCAQLEYGKLATWLIQQGKKGSGGLTNILSIEAYEAREERNKVIRIKGERISMKLLGPMMGFMGIVMMIVIIPAFYGM